MESSRELSNESFSHKWLVDVKPSLASFLAEEGSSSIEKDPGCVSKCWTIDINGFHFDSSRDKSPVLDHRYLKATATQTKRAPRSESLNPSTSPSSLNALTLSNSGHEMTITSDLASRNTNQKSTNHCSLKKILRYLCLPIPLFKGAKHSRLISPNSSKRYTNSAGSSRRMSTSTSSIEWCHSNADISISDAILHCKRSTWQEKYKPRIAEEHG